jgi:hypothetical protein
LPFSYNTWVSNIISVQAKPDTLNKRVTVGFHLYVIFVQPFGNVYTQYQNIMT